MVASPDLSGAEAPLIEHLLELRNRLIKCVIVILGVFLVCAPFANQLYEFLAQPLMQSLPAGNSMISTEPHGPFLVPFKFAFAFSFALVMPYLLYQIWAFVAPGLYKHEQNLVLPLVVSSSLLFYLGIIFAYFVVFPVIFAFFASSAPDGVAVMTDINSYLSFTLKLFFAFGIAFEVPIATVLLIRMGIAKPDELAKKRPYVIVVAFVAGMLLTPPDIFSQTMLAIPIWILFEIGLICGRMVIKNKKNSDTDSSDDSQDNA